MTLVAGRPPHLGRAPWPILAVLATSCAGAGCASLLGIDEPTVVNDDGGVLDSSVNNEAGGETGSETGGESGADSGAGAEAAGNQDAHAEAAAPPSCAPGGDGVAHCGSMGVSCCASLEVEGGTYSRTYVNEGGGATGEADPATISAFRLDEFEVTVGRFRQFVSAVLPADGGTGWLPDAGSGKHVHLNGGRGLVSSTNPATFEPGWVAADDGNIAPTNTNLACDPSFATWTNVPAGNESLPINCVNWWESYAFCIWDDGFLPSEAEWEYAAAGGSDEREYPWGSDAPGTQSQYAIYGCLYMATGTCTGVSNIAPVGTAPLGVGRFGQLDLAGDSWEWNLDWWGAAYGSPCSDCANVTMASQARTFRGGDFYNPATDLLPPARNSDMPDDRAGLFGIRCARVP